VTSYRELDADVDAILSRVHLAERRSALAGDLAYGEQRQLELALALVGRPKLLLLDEPTAGMSPAETDAMMTMLQALPRDLTILIVEHDMDVVFALADRVTVMHLGEVLTDGTPEEIQQDTRVTQVYFGQGGGRA
jgi:branched-chain amino acid transport system ATP-binding protein